MYTNSLWSTKTTVTAQKMFIQSNKPQEFNVTCSSWEKDSSSPTLNVCNTNQTSSNLCEAIKPTTTDTDVGHKPSSLALNNCSSHVTPQTNIHFPPIMLSSFTAIHSFLCSQLRLSIWLIRVQTTQINPDKSQKKTSQVCFCRALLLGFCYTRCLSN